MFLEIDIFNRLENMESRRKLRNNMPEPEKKLWSHIRNEQLGYKFRRQHGIGNYIVDFFCSTKGLIIEIDGDTHFSSKAIDYDVKRTNYLNALGLKVIRFNNNDIMNNIEGVVEVLRKEINKCDPT